MTNQEIATLILEETNELVYISDPETYELKYMNQACSAVIGNPPEEVWFNAPCYKVLQGKDAPCEFCTNSRLTTEKYYVWDYYNPILDKYFMLKDKLIDMNGIICRLEIAMDISEKEHARQILDDKLLLEETLLSCIQTLNQNQNMDSAINQFLEIIGNYYCADRAYIFELKYAERIACNSFEWCKENITPQIDNLRDVPIEMADAWLEQFEKSGEFYVSALNSSFIKGSGIYHLLEAQQIDSMIAAPLILDGSFFGFLGVDNPTQHIENTSLVKSVATFVMDDLKQRELLQELSKQSYTDSLTGMYNRNKYTQILSELNQKPPETLGIVYVDINGLKTANDEHGHQFGDFIIKKTAALLSQVFDSAWIYRIGGDEFVIICPDISRSSFSIRISEMRKLIERDEEIRLSIGVSWNKGEIDITRQIMHTDELMYIDKEKYYNLSTRPHTAYRAKLAASLTAEIENHQYVVYLQPKVNLKTGTSIGAEALVRKVGANGEIISPMEFIPRFESEGIIHHIDFFVFETVCRLLQSWSHIIDKDFSIAVNVSRITLLHNDIASKFLAICRNYNVSPSSIIIEVTESVAMLNKDELQTLITSLKDVGFSVVLDDFGSDYSNLALLTSMGFNEIKLDRSLIENLESNEKSRLVTAYTINLCKGLNQSLSVAEGIETIAQRDILLEMQCDIGQGYFFSRPISTDDFYKNFVAITKVP